VQREMAPITIGLMMSGVSVWVVKAALLCAEVSSKPIPRRTI
jgi:hypothetical protein